MVSSCISFSQNLSCRRLKYQIIGPEFILVFQWHSWINNLTKKLERIIISKCYRELEWHRVSIYSVISSLQISNKINYMTTNLINCFVYSTSGLMRFPWLSTTFSMLQVESIIARLIKSCKIMNSNTIKKVKENRHYFLQNVFRGRFYETYPGK